MSDEYLGHPHTSAGATERIEARFTSERRLGAWTDARRFDVHALRSSVQLDLRSNRIPAGDLEVCLDSERSSVKLRVPDDAVIDISELRRVGRTKFHGEPGRRGAGGRVVRLTGELRDAEIRIARGGAATPEEGLSQEFVDACRTLYHEGRRLAAEHGPRHAR
ncbi:hypothetical protein [Streptomyces morookaense]|uniref:Uncharacterized protein n=1 Tax=Streptomyces morookaense TaxID=1970 RepID=A0A7Y7E6P6_STRMO|nr:hypothetical protein [Streptomyces morookaense]NVK77519.1 hypothetical protein [Streptomyces morookaense]GHF22238.1 hypothetical protein GCM10010359_24980 [Streptomyces morookaense]